MLQPQRHAPPLSPALAGLLSAQARVRYLGSGTANPHWLIEDGDNTWVWRQFGAPQQAPGANHDHEAAILATLAHTHWSAKLITYLPDAGMLFEHAPGSHPDPTHLDPTQRAALIDALIECWHCPVSLPPRDYPALIRHYAALAPPSPRRDQLAATLIAGSAHWRQPNLRLTHHDLHPGNLLLADRCWTILDWEYAALGNPWLDASALDQMLALTAPERTRIETALSPISAAASPWQSIAAWCAALDELWGLARR